MGLFDFLKKTKNDVSPKESTDSSARSTAAEPSTDLNSPEFYADSSTISPDERPYYQPDSYYTFYSYPGTMMAQRVITFDERKRSTIPSARGLFVAEVLLLEYCRQGKYPKPASGYPGFWWFKYGIRDVGHALQSLEQRGFIRWASKYSCLHGLKVEELRQILDKAGLPTSGKKADLIERISKSIPEESLQIPNYVPKYELTDIGQLELDQNGYVPYMHRHKNATTEDNRFGDTFTVWDINKLFPDGDASNWRNVVGDIELKRFGVAMANAESAEPHKQRGKANESLAKKEEMRSFLASMQDTINRGVKTPGDGFDEESKGLNYIKIGKDKEAFLQLFIAIGKRFDAPALYRETSKLLRKYGLYEEELSVIEAGLKVVPKNNRHYEDLLKRREKAIEQIQKNN